MLNAIQQPTVREITVQLTCPIEWVDNPVLFSLWDSYSRLLRPALSNYADRYLKESIEVDGYQPGLMNYDKYTIVLRGGSEVTEHEVVQMLKLQFIERPLGVSYTISADYYPRDPWATEY